MKGFLTGLLFLLTLQINAQDFNETLTAIRSAEANTALRQIMDSQNANTGNYDVKYHRLELDVDPSVAQIAGYITTYFEAKEAMDMSVYTALGAASLLIENKSHPEAEIDKVTTPRGCTITGLNEMEHQGLSSSLIQGLAASFNKINEISTQ